MKRLLRAGAAALTLGLGASACASIDHDAAVVNGTHTSVRGFERLLRELRDAGATDLTTANGTVPAERARQMLTTIIVTDLIHAEFGRRGLTADAAAAEPNAVQLVGVDTAAWTKLPEATRAEWAQKTAEFLALRDSFAGAAPTESEIAAYYEQNKDQMSGAQLADVRDQIVEVMQSDDSNAGLRELIQGAKVKVNARYGTWDPGQGVVSLVPAVTTR